MEAWQSRSLPLWLRSWMGLWLCGAATCLVQPNRLVGVFLWVSLSFLPDLDSLGGHRPGWYCHDNAGLTSAWACRALNSWRKPASC